MYKDWFVGKDLDGAVYIVYYSNYHLKMSSVVHLS